MVKTEWARKQSQGEEIANSISHGVAFLAATAITPVMILESIPMGGAAIVGACIFGATMMILYLSSTLYHAFSQGKAKRVLQVFDHSAIFLLIAGTYTPLTLSATQGVWGWLLFAVVWMLAIAGVVLKSLSRGGTSKLSIVLYVGMGWLAVIAVQPLWNTLPSAAIFWLVAGAVMYTAGVLFFMRDHRSSYNHFIWHLFVMCGTACHVATILGYTY